MKYSVIVMAALLSGCGSHEPDRNMDAIINTAPGYPVRDLSGISVCLERDMAKGGCIKWNNPSAWCRPKSTEIAIVPCSSIE